MDEKREGFIRYESTRTIGDLASCRATSDVLQWFLNCPVDIVRAQCLEDLRQRSVENEEMADLLEEVIPKVFLVENNLAYGNYWEKLLSWYLFNCEVQNPSLRLRAFEFTTALFLSNENAALVSIRPALSKMIAGVVRKHPELYWAPSVPEFLKESLGSGDWMPVERALDLICRAEDTSFLPRVMELSRAALKEKDEKEDFKTKASDERFASAKARGVLGEAVRRLLICSTEQNKNVTIARSN